MKIATIGFVEDDLTIRENYSELLTDEGYEVRSHEGRVSAMDDFGRSCPDIVLIDVALGRERDGGYQLCSHLRARYPLLPIIFLTSFDSEIDKISGLRLGADDYLSKDTSTAYLLVRIETLLRRKAALQQGRDSGPQRQSVEAKLTIDKRRSVISWNGRDVELPLTQFWIVEDLITSGSVRTLEQLMRAGRIVVEPNTIAAHIKNIRRKFKEIDTDFDCIRTERGLGYRWVPD
jgi:two-component system OmpR family response regulator